MGSGGGGGLGRCKIHSGDVRSREVENEVESQRRACHERGDDGYQCERIIGPVSGKGKSRSADVSHMKEIPTGVHLETRRHKLPQEAPVASISVSFSLYAYAVGTVPLVADLHHIPCMGHTSWSVQLYDPADGREGILSSPWIHPARGSVQERGSPGTNKCNAWQLTYPYPPPYPPPYILET